MFGIGQFFGKIQNSFAKEMMIRTLIRESLKKIVGADIPIESISFKNEIIILKNINQAAKSAIFIKKRQILDEITFKQSVKVFKDIR